MTIRGKAEAAAAEATVPEATTEQAPELAAAEATAPVEKPAKTRKASKKPRKYELITPYPIVSPQGVRFLQGQPVLHDPTDWIAAQIKLGILKEA